MTSTELNSTHVDDENTALAPSEEATEHAYAWSLAETTDLDAPTERYSWVPVGIFAGLMAIVVLAATLTVGVWLTHRRTNTAVPMPVPTSQAPTTPDDQIVPTPIAPPPVVAAAPPAPPTQTVTVTPTPEAAPPAQTIAPPRPSIPTLDEQFLSELTGAGFIITSVPDAINDGHATCDYLAAGHTESETVQAGLGNNSPLSRANAITIIDTAIAVYCPEYSGVQS